MVNLNCINIIFSFLGVFLYLSSFSQQLKEPFDSIDSIRHFSNPTFQSAPEILGIPAKRIIIVNSKVNPQKIAFTATINKEGNVTQIKMVKNYQTTDFVDTIIFYDYINEIKLAPAMTGGGPVGIKHYIIIFEKVKKLDDSRYLYKLLNPVNKHALRKFKDY